MDPTKTTPKRFDFPILKTIEILHLLNDAGVELTAEELADPAKHKEKMKTVWVALVRNTCVTCNSL